MQVDFKILRQTTNSSPRFQTYRLEIDPEATILDGLNLIKWEQDGSLGYRKNCRNTICGSCAIRINGRSALACKENIRTELNRLAVYGEAKAPSHPEQDSPSDPIPVITIAPLGNMPVIKDLVVNMDSFWQNLQAVDPYVSTAGRNLPEREFLQSPADRAKLDQTGNCILCGACYSDCNAREVNPEFVGPHALAKAYRTLADTRDQATVPRLQKYNQETSGVWACTRCFNCNTVCPMDVAPLDQISLIKGQILHQPGLSAQRSIRHRLALVNLVKQGGWIDENRFVLKAVGNNFRDWRGLLSLTPLALRMLSRGKFPIGFKPSLGTAQVRSLIVAVQALKSTKPPASILIDPAPMTSAPESQTDLTQSPPPPAFGWTSYAEVLNGRFAMIGLIALLILELISHQDFFTWLGLR
jgi:succinate dehydrogenase / fumarate reductase, iron-sulfur subunit